MPILYKRIRTKNGDFITRTKCFYYNPVNSKKHRGVRLCKTGESKQERNKRNSYLKKKYEILNNFNNGDLWVTLTERNLLSGKDAHKNMTSAISQLRKYCIRHGIPFVYYAKTEAAEETEVKVRPHHHLFIRNTDHAILGKLMELWQKYGKISDVKTIYSLDDEKLVTYFLNGGNHKELDFEKYTHSRNLEQPKVERRIYPYNSFRENPRPPKCEEYGYRYEIRDLYNGFPDRDGFTYQECRLVKVKEIEEDIREGKKCQRRI